MITATQHSMTPQEMRAHSEKTFQQIKSGFEEHQNPPSANVSIRLHTLQALWEIAAQLAELNGRSYPELSEKGKP